MLRGVLTNTAEYFGAEHGAEMVLGVLGSLLSLMILNNNTYIRGGGSSSSPSRSKCQVHDIQVQWN